MREATMRSMASVAAATGVAVALAGCGAEPYAAGSTMERIADNGTIAIGIKHDQPLFGELDDKGVPQGFDVEIARLIASELGVEEDGITWVETPSGEREQAIVDGDVDLVVATYTMSDARKEHVGFAGPYYVAGQSLLVRTDDTEISSALDLANNNVCSVGGSTAASTIERMVQGVNLVLFDDYSACVEPLYTGQVDAITTDDVILAGYAAESDGELTLVGGTFTAEPYGIGLAREDTEFRMWVNDVLEDAYEDGRWLEAWQDTAGEVLPTPQRPYLDRYAPPEGS